MEYINSDVNVNVLEDSQFLISNTEEQLLQLLEDTPNFTDSTLLNASSSTILDINTTDEEFKQDLEPQAEFPLQPATTVTLPAQPTFFVAGHLQGGTLYLLEQPQASNNTHSSEGSGSDSSYDSPAMLGENFDSCGSSPLSDGSPRSDEQAVGYGFSHGNQKKRSLSHLDDAEAEAKEFQFDGPLDKESLKNLSSQELEKYTEVMAAAKMISPEELKELKRQRRLQKNREYAQQSRRKKKTYVSELEQRVQSLEEENKKLKTQVERLSVELKRSKGATHITNPAIPVIFQATPSTLFPSTSCSISFIQADSAKKDSPLAIKTGLSNKVRVVGTCLMILLFSFGFLFESPFLLRTSHLQTTNVHHTGRILFSEGDEELWFGVLPVRNLFGERASSWMYHMISSYLPMWDPLHPDFVSIASDACLDCDDSSEVWHARTEVIETQSTNGHLELLRYHNAHHTSLFNMTEFAVFW